MERPDSLETALGVWQSLRSEQGCERTVNILQKISRNKELVKKYGRWVFEMRPDIGLKLFTEGQKNSSADVGFKFNPNPSVDMDVDEVLRFLNEMQTIAPKRTDKRLDLTYEQKYLHRLCDIPNAPEKYFTDFAKSVIDTLYREYPRKMRSFDAARDGKFSF